MDLSLLIRAVQAEHGIQRIALGAVLSKETFGWPGLSLYSINNPEEAVLLVLDAGGEEKLVRLPPFSTIAEGHTAY